MAGVQESVKAVRWVLLASVLVVAVGIELQLLLVVDTWEWDSWDVVYVKKRETRLT